MEDFGFDGVNSPLIKKLLHAVDNYILDPERDVRSSFMIPIDNAFSDPVRSTVVVGTLSRGTFNKNSEAELVGCKSTYTLLY